METQVADEVGVDETVGEPPLVVLPLEAIVPAAGQDRLERQLGARLERGVVGTSRCRLRSPPTSTITLVTTCFVDGTPS